ncbi:potassium transporter Kup [Methylovirgula sp. 4M-Z18]|uniref:potassium transporter Kup n=1 Tax=Methylovirgula sp. 4M-Z18 TaxID=2293567 RepID=UPI000E2EA9A6|nr:KUP/HAK/KT family potassium transporter [Methylovirgula sp. 4M-Z18]RFB79755.1 potassium transporter Kup [Methylovirgula sp. 4M-Z18]
MTPTAKTGLAHERSRGVTATALACMGIVFGDIGTSPLYALQVAINSATPTGASPASDAVIGIVSLIFWSLIVVISIKYAILIMRADNHGEGGILALLALVSPQRAKKSAARALFMIVGLVGATLLYGDGAITPAMSVLSAIEGLKVYAPQTEHVVVPLTVVILVVLFFFQKKGTSWIGGIFGPIMLVWFAVIGVLGVSGIMKGPAILAAFSPWPAIDYLWHAGPLAFTVIGSAFLAVTGGEALYADMGHFGPFPIRVAWFAVALPTLTLNYFGQGGLLLADPSAIENPFYRLAPEWSHYGLIALATAATVIASQAIITGAYSLTQQAVQLGFLPRMNIIHTAGHERGQIYMPLVNWVLAAATLTAVLGFRSSDALAGAYGIAVSLLMVITTVLAAFVALQWKHSPLIIIIVNGSLFLLELLYFGSASTKLLEGGWFPLSISFIIAFIMMTWRRGEEIMDLARLAIRQTVTDFNAGLKTNPPFRIPGTAVVLGRMTKGIPLALSQNLKLNHVLHEKVLLVAVEVAETPRVPEEERAIISKVSDDISRVELRYGFMESPDVPDGLRTALAREQIAKCELSKVTYYTGHETIIAGGLKDGMARWREGLFALMHHNAQRPGAYFNIPAEQIMEIGLEFKI